MTIKKSIENEDLTYIMHGTGVRYKLRKFYIETLILCNNPMILPLIGIDPIMTAHKEAQTNLLVMLKRDKGK